MTRPALLLVLIFVAIGVAGVPFAFIIAGDGGGDGAGGKRRGDVDVVAGDGDGARHHGGRFAWLGALARSFGEFAGAEEQARVATRPELVTLDRMIDAGVTQCAPEIFGYDRKLLERMQSDWHVLKPNLAPSWDAWLALPGVVVDDELMARCNGAFSGDDCAAMEMEWEECTRPFRGTLGADEACETNEQCASSRCVGDKCTAPDDCASLSGCPQGMLCADDGTGFHTCVDAPGDGEGCLSGGGEDEKAPGVDPSCGGDRVCNRDEVCVTARVEGQKCSSLHPCAYELYCKFEDDDDDATYDSDEGSIGRCVKDDDEPYVDDGDDGGQEEEGGEAIADADDDGPGCMCDPYRDGMACVDDPAQDRLKCVPVDVVDDGDACDDTHICRGALGIAACIEGRCQRALGVGDACDDHDQCKDDLVCIDGGCASPHHDGEECMDSDDCIFGLDCIDRDGRSVCGISFETDTEDESDTSDGDDAIIRVDDIVINGAAPEELPDDDGALVPLAPPDDLDELRESLRQFRLEPID